MFSLGHVTLNLPVGSLYIEKLEFGQYLCMPRHAFWRCPPPPAWIAGSNNYLPIWPMSALGHVGLFSRGCIFKTVIVRHISILTLIRTPFHWLKFKTLADTAKLNYYLWWIGMSFHLVLYVLWPRVTLRGQIAVMHILGDCNLKTPAKLKQPYVYCYGHIYYWNWKGIHTLFHLEPCSRYNDLGFSL